MFSLKNLYSLGLFFLNFFFYMEVTILNVTSSIHSYQYQKPIWNKRSLRSRTPLTARLYFLLVCFDIYMLRYWSDFFLLTETTKLKLKPPMCYQYSNTESPKINYLFNSFSKNLFENKFLKINCFWALYSQYKGCDLRTTIKWSPQK